MKTLYLIVFTFFAVFLLSSPIYAESSNKQDNVVLSKDAVVEQTYFAAGNTVTILGTVNSDAYIAGSSILIDGTINGDLLVAGGSVVMNGHVTGDVRTAGGTITIDGIVDGNVTAGGGSITISKNATVGKAIVIGGGQVSIQGPVGKDATIGAGSLMIDNSIGGNVLAGIGQMQISPNASIHGDLTYYAEKKATVPSGEVVTGKVNFHQQTITKDKEKVTQQTQQAAAVAGLGFKVYSALVAFLIGLVFIKWLPAFSLKSISILNAKPLTALGIGVLIFFLLPIALILLCVTIVGIPVAFMVLAIYLICMYIVKIFVALFIGMKVLNWAKWGNSLVLALFVGLLLWILLTSIPVIGGVVQMIVMMMGIGTVYLLKNHYYTTLRTKNLL